MASVLCLSDKSLSPLEVTSYLIKGESLPVTKVFANGTLGPRLLMQFMPGGPAVIEIT